MESIENFTIEHSNTISLIRVFEMFFGSCPDGIVYKDKDLNYLSANQAFYKIFKVENERDFIGRKDAKFLSPDNQKLIKDVNNTILKEFLPVNYIMNPCENKILSITSLPIIDNKTFLGIMSIIRDITHEENIKEQFVIKHFQLKSLLENIPMLIYMQDKNFNYIAGTKSSQNFVSNGYDSFSNIQVNHSRGKNEEIEDNKYVFNNNKILVKEKEFVDFKESPHWYKVYKVPINDFNGNVTGVITLANNIDAEKQLQSQRESFVASIGHDLKNPTIAQIRGLELLLKGEFGDITQDQRELVEMVLDSCRYMNGMLSSLLETYRNYGGVIKLNFQEFSLPDLVMECVAEMIYVAKDKNVGISIDSRLKNEIVIADRVQIKRVIMNFLSNGIKYAYKNTILKLSIYPERGVACFEFENESPYIPKDKQKSIFAQYVTYASAHKELGIGLGLYTSKRIIEGHNGKIFVKSFEDNRNIFGFKIPVKQKLSNNRDICF